MVDNINCADYQHYYTSKCHYRVRETKRIRATRRPSATDSKVATPFKRVTARKRKRLEDRLEEKNQPTERERGILSVTFSCGNRHMG